MSIPLITTNAQPGTRPTTSLFQEGPSYPVNHHFINNHVHDPRRTVSNPSIPSPPTVVLTPTAASAPPFPLASSTRRARDQLGQRPLTALDMATIQELVSLKEEEIASLDASLQRTRAVAARAHERSQDFERRRHELSNMVLPATAEDESVYAKAAYEALSAKVAYEAALESVQALEVNKDAQEKALKRHKGLLHPIRRLPDEVLELIMFFTVENEERDRRNELLFWHESQSHSHDSTRSNTVDDDDVYLMTDSQQLQARRHWHRRTPSLLSLSLVCTDWRKVAIEAPSLWRTVYFQLSGQPNVGSKSWDRVRLFLRRARHDPSGSIQTNGMSLVFTGWAEHGHPSSDASFRKVMRLLSIPDPLAREWSAETPGHSRRTSLVDNASSTTMTMTPLPNDIDFTRLMPSPPLSPPPAIDLEPSNRFRINRFEMVFDTLCEHPNAMGVISNAQMSWPSTSPKPEEVAFIAKDAVYQTPPHSTGELLNLQTPPYASSLIPWAKRVMLCNLRYRWTMSTTDSVDDAPAAYSNLTYLCLIFTRHFPTLLENPQSNEQLGFLQFLKVAPNLKKLEIRISSSSSFDITTSTSNISTPQSAFAALPQVNGTTASAVAVKHTSLCHLTISLQDLFTICPLFIPDQSRLNAPVILLPSLHQLTLLSHRPGSSAPLSQRDDAQQMAQRLTHFLTLTEAKIRHLEFAPWSAHRESNDLPGSTDGRSSLDDTATTKSQKKEIEFALRQFHSVETFEVWGNDLTTDVMDILGLGKLLKDTTTSPPLLLATNATSLPPRTEPPTTTAPLELPLTTTLDGTSGSLTVTTTTASHRSNSSSPAGSHKRSKKRSILGPKEIIATVIAAATSSSSFKRRSLALVGTPEHTPRITVNELPIDTEDCAPPPLPLPQSQSQPPPTRPVTVNGHGGTGWWSARRSGRSLSSGSTEPSLARVDSNSSGHRVVIAAASPLSAEPVTIQKEAVVPHSVKKLIVHDASDFTLDMVKGLTERGIEVVTYG